MSDEQNVVLQTDQPVTVSAMMIALRQLGLQPGDTVIVHIAMSKLGWVVGGAVAVIDALMRAVSPRGTLVMPAHSGDNSDPSRWQNPPVPEAWWPIIRNEMPAYRPEVMPTRGMGRIPELFRTYPNVLRSNHPSLSFAAWGEYAEFIVNDHPLESGLGEHSPLARIYNLDGKVLLVGVDHRNNTSLHLAEHRAAFPGKGYIKQGAAWMVAGQRQWVEWEELDYDEDDFGDLGAAYEASIGYTPGVVGKAAARLQSQRALVDFGVTWLEAHRAQKPDATS